MATAEELAYNVGLHGAKNILRILRIRIDNTPLHPAKNPKL